MRTVLRLLGLLGSRILGCEFDDRGSPQGFRHSMDYIGLSVAKREDWGGGEVF